jgi:hypothetical protein
MPLSSSFATDIFNSQIAALSPADLQSLFGPGLSQHSRLIKLQTAQESKLPQALVAERFWSREGVNELFHFEVDCLSVSTALTRIFHATWTCPVCTDSARTVLVSS